MSVKIYSVSEISKLIKDILESNFYGIWIEGEVSSLRYSSTGHLYFSLVDDTSSIGVIVYKNRIRNIKFNIKNGTNIVVFGSLSLYLKGGEYRVVAEHIQPSGEGKKFYDLEKLKREFKEQGYFDRKKNIPLLPKNVIVVTSPTGAAVSDIINILNRRGVGLNVFIYPVAVQGKSSKDSLISAFEKINTLNNADIVIVARGGGSNEDLWIFNDPDVAKGLFRVKFPTISAIGHEIDFTLCDFVADLRAETPSAAAEIITKSKREMLEGLKKTESLLNSDIQRILSNSARKLKLSSAKRNYIRLRSLLNNRIMYADNLQERLNFEIKNFINAKFNKLRNNTSTLNRNNPINRLHSVMEKADFLRYKLNSQIKNNIENRAKALDFYRYKLKSLNPKNILKKGYTITTDKNGKPVKSAKAAVKQEILLTQFRDGKVESAVLTKNLFDLEQ